MQQDSSPRSRRPVSMAHPKLQIETQTIGQWQQTGPAAIDSPRSPTKTLRNASNESAESPKATSKPNLATLSARFSKDKPAKETPPNKPKKTRSSTNIKDLLLSRPRSNKNLTISTDSDGQQGKNKENRKPSDPQSPAITPIYAQFCRNAPGGAASVPSSPYEVPADPFTQASLLNLNNSFRPAQSNGVAGSKQRPKSFQPQYMSKPELTKMDEQKDTRGRHKPDGPPESHRSSTWAKPRSGSRARVMSALTNLGGRNSKSASPSPEPEPSEPQIDPKDVDKHLEEMLNRRNIPENQRYKMRNLNSTIKMEFIRQDWAEAEGKRLGRRPTNDSDDSAVVVGRDSVRGDANDKKHTRGRSFTFSRNSWKIGSSPSKGKKKEGPMKSHSRNKSTDSVVLERPTSSGSHSTSGIIAKVTGQQPSDFVNYLRKVQKPEAVEVGKLHKLRLLLRNERVAWTEDFIRQGGMKEIVGLLQRIMDVEWR